jgi:DDE_Tnp_1-associated/Transposase DDE domain
MSNSLAANVPSLIAALQAVPDHRQASGKRHQLPSILAFICCGMLCGAKSLLAVFEWGREHQDWCMQVFGFERCTPCVNTLHLLLKNLDVVAFEVALHTWIATQLSAETIPLELIAIDGKAVRGAKEQNLPCVHLLSAYAAKREMVLAQVAIARKENEITQALPLLSQLNLEATVITADAIFTQRSLCREIVNQGGNYLLEVKGNQSGLKLAIAEQFFWGSVSWTGHKQWSSSMVDVKFGLSIPEQLSHSSWTGPELVKSVV